MALRHGAQAPSSDDRAPESEPVVSSSSRAPRSRVASSVALPLPMPRRCAAAVLVIPGSDRTTARSAAAPSQRNCADCLGSWAISGSISLYLLVARVYSRPCDPDRRSRRRARASQPPARTALARDGLMPGGDHRDAAGGPPARHRGDVLDARVRHRAAGHPLRDDGRRACGAVDRRHDAVSTGAPSCWRPCSATS